MGTVFGLGRSPGGGNGNPLQYSCLKNLMDRGGRWATVHRVTKSQTQPSDYVCIHTLQIPGFSTQLYPHDLSGHF